MSEKTVAEFEKENTQLQKQTEDQANQIAKLSARVDQLTNFINRYIRITENMSRSISAIMENTAELQKTEIDKIQESK